MLLEEFCKCRDWDIECIIAIVLLDSRELGLSGYSTGFLELIDERLWLGIDGILEWFEGVLGGIV